RRAQRYRRGGGAPGDAPDPFSGNHEGGRKPGPQAGVPDAGDVSRDEHDRLQGQRCGDLQAGRRDQGNAGEDSRADSERGMTTMAPLIIVSGPSGSGKSTIVRRLLDEMPWLRLSVSVTTRQPRINEQPGVHYHFWSVPDFLKARDKGRFLEWAE